MRSFYLTRYLISGLPFAGELKATYLNHHEVPCKMTSETNSRLSTNGWLKQWLPTSLMWTIGGTSHCRGTICTRRRFLQRRNALRSTSKTEFSAVSIAQNCSILSHLTGPMALQSVGYAHQDFHFQHRAVIFISVMYCTWIGSKKLLNHQEFFDYSESSPDRVCGRTNKSLDENVNSRISAFSIQIHLFMLASKQNETGW